MTQNKNYIEEDDITQSHLAVYPVFVSFPNTDAATTIIISPCNCILQLRNTSS